MRSYRFPKASLRAVISLLLCLLLLPGVPVTVARAQPSPLDDGLTTSPFPAPTPTPTPTPLPGTTISIDFDPPTVVAGVETNLTVSGNLTRTDTGEGVAGSEVRLEWPTGSSSIPVDPSGYYTFMLVVNSTQNWVFQISFPGNAEYGRCWNSKTLTVTATSVMRPGLQGWKLSKTDPKAGEIITISYGLNNLTGEPATVGLGASIRQTGDTEEIKDTPGDKIVTAGVGFGWYTRTFLIPAGAVGSYDISLTLWSGQPEESTWVDSTGWVLEQLNIPYPEFQVSSLTVSPSSGDTETEFIFSVAVAGGSSSYTVYLLDTSDQELIAPQTGSPSTITFTITFETPGSYSMHAVAADTAGNRAETNGVSVFVSPVATRKPEIKEFSVPEGPVGPGDRLSLQLGLRNIETDEKKFSVRLSVSLHDSPADDIRIWEDIEIYNQLVLFKAGESKVIPIKWTVPGSAQPGSCGVKLQIYDEAENLLVKLEKLSPVVDTNVSYVELDGNDAVMLMHIHLNSRDMEALRTNGADGSYSVSKEDFINLLRETRISSRPELGFFLDSLAPAPAGATGLFIPAYSLDDGSGGVSLLYYPRSGRTEFVGAPPAQIIEEYKGQSVADILNLISGTWWEKAAEALENNPWKAEVKLDYGIRLPAYYSVFYTGAAAYIYPETLKRIRGEDFTLSVVVDPKDQGVSSGEITVSFDPQALEVRDITPGTLFGQNASVIKKVKDNATGGTVIAMSRTGPTAPPTKADYFAHISFTVRSGARAGEYPVSISKISLTDENGHAISRIETRQAVITLGGKTGDADVNGTVDSRDLTILREAYGMSRDKAGFDPAVDFNNDGLIDYRDLAILGANYEG